MAKNITTRLYFSSADSFEVLVIGLAAADRRPTIEPQSADLYKIRPFDLAIVRSSPGRGRTYNVPAMLRSAYLLADKGYVRPGMSKTLSLACPARSYTDNIQQMISYTNFGCRVKNSSEYLFFMELLCDIPDKAIKPAHPV